MRAALAERWRRWWTARLPRTDTLALTLGNAELFHLPAGPAGFAGVIEAGNQAYDLNPDPLATQYYYYSWKDSDGHGSRNRWAAAGELRAPLQRPFVPLRNAIRRLTRGTGRSRSQIARDRNKAPVPASHEPLPPA